MTKEELARAIAAEMGPEVAAEAEAELSREKTKSFGEFIVDAATVGGFIVQMTELAIQLCAPDKSPAELIAALQAKAASAIGIADEIRRKLVEHVVVRLTRTKIDTGGASLAEPQGKRIALVIGNAAYVHAGLLANPVNDAHGMAEKLETLGFAAITGTDLAHDAMAHALYNFEAAIRDAEVALLFYSGHGLQVKNENYLLPVDANVEMELHLRHRAFSLSDVLGVMNERAQTSLVFLDACRNNPFSRSLSRSLGLEGERALRSGLASVHAAEGTFIAFATAPNAVALDGKGGNSPFTEAMLKHVGTPGLSVMDMMIDVSREVAQMTDGRQRPWQQSDLQAKFYFKPLETPIQSAVEVQGSQIAGHRPERRIEIAAPFVTNANGNRFLPGAGKTEWFNDLEAGPEMVVVPAGKFLMGSPESELQRWKSDGPRHEVTIPKPFAIGRCAVTREQFAAFVADTGHEMEGAVVWTPDKGWGRDPTKSWRDPGFAQDNSHPVVCVSWSDAQAYLAWLSEASGATYRLPTEAEWEYACRARTITPFWRGPAIAPDWANYNGSAEPYKGGGWKGAWRKQTVTAESFAANPWGLYQVHGNVHEWCEDLWNDSYAEKPEDLKETAGAWTTGNNAKRVLRGGSWWDDPQLLRSACRNYGHLGNRNSNIGFRVARTITP